MKAIRIFSILIVLISCQGPKKPSEWNKSKTTERISQMLDAYHDDIRRDGLTAEFKYLDNSSDFFWVPPGYRSALTYDSVRSILESSAKAFRTIDFEWDTLQIFPLTNDIANYTGIVRGQMTDTSGVELNVAVIESGTLIKRTDGWKLLNGQSRSLNMSSH